MKIKFIDTNKELVKKVKKAIPHFQYEIGDIMDIYNKTKNAVIVTASNPDFNMSWWLDRVIYDNFKEICDKKEKNGENERIENIIFTITVDKNLKSSKKLIYQALQTIMRYGEEDETILLTGLGTGIGWLSDDDFIEVLKDFFPRKCYKAFDEWFKCKKKSFEIWKTYSEKDAKLCIVWYHYCHKLPDVYLYYNNPSHICEVEILWEVDFWNNKCSTKKIKILRELDEYEISILWDNNTWNGNSWNYNSWNFNTWNFNTWNYNSWNGNSWNFNTESHLTYIFNKSYVGKIDYPSYFYFQPNKDITYQENRTKAFDWANMFEINKTINLPNFDYNIFAEITGITKEMIDKRFIILENN